MSTQLLDDKKNPFPTYARVPGSATVETVTSAVDVVFEPDPVLTKVKHYEVRTTADLRIAVHDDSHVFSASTEPVMWAGEIDVVDLGPIGVHSRTMITMRAVSANATVTITELA